MSGIVSSKTVSFTKVVARRSALSAEPSTNLLQPQYIRSSNYAKSGRNTNGTSTDNAYPADSLSFAIGALEQTTKWLSKLNNRDTILQQKL